MKFRFRNSQKDLVQMKNRYYVLSLFLFASLLVGITGCKSKVQDESEVFNVAKPWRENVELPRQYVGQIRAIQHIEIRAFEKGYLQEVYVNEGQLVKKGDKLFQIMPYLMQAEYQKSKAEYEISRLEYVNTEGLAKQKVVSRNELALAKAKCDKYSAEMNLSKTHLDLTTITAPFDGIIDRFRVRLGSLLEEGALLTTLSDISQLWVYFNLSEADYLNYMAQQKGKSPVSTVHLQLANGKLFQYPGQVNTIEADFNNETGNVPFRATFPNPDLLLRHGETGDVLLTEPLADALLIPQKATFEVMDKRYVYVVDDKGVLDAREIVVYNEVPHLFVVKSGITERDTVLMDGIGKLSKGNVIRTKLLAKSEVMKGLELRTE